jgi:hypothetical protein
MTSIITGDIIHSQKVDPSIWLDVLKKELLSIGSHPEHWEIYRGDSFQAEVKDPEDVIETAVKIKAAVKSIKNIDVRMAIGIGEKSHHSFRITESNGTVFVYSGEQFENMPKEKQTLAVASGNERFDRDVNLILKLALIGMNSWSVNSAQMVKLAMENPDKSQKELGKLIGIKQNAVSNRLKRAYFDEVSEMICICKSKIKELLL